MTASLKTCCKSHSCLLFNSLKNQNLLFKVLNITGETIYANNTRILVLLNFICFQSLAVLYIYFSSIKRNLWHLSSSRIFKKYKTHNIRRALRLIIIITQNLHLTEALSEKISFISQKHSMR